MIVNALVTLALLAAPLAAARTPGAGGGPHVKMTATGGYNDGATRVVEGYLDLDSDNDGIQDQVVLRVTCARGAVISAIVSPRDPASGLATGKRMHKPTVITRELDRANPMASDDWSKRLQGKPTVASWDLATMKGGRESAPPSVSERTITPGDVSPTVCAA